MEREIKNVGIALSSSVDEFRAERLELGDFIRFLNEHIYKPRRIRLDWRVCEDESGAVTHGRRQEVFNGQIKECRFFYLLVGRHIGQYTREEFDVALSLFNASADNPSPEARDIPKIFPYFKEMPDAERTSAALDFRTYLHERANGGQYGLKFAHIDTLKLRMLTEFGRDAALWGKVTVEDNEARIDGQRVMSVDNIPAYANHRNLKRLRRQKAALDSEYAELSLRYHAGDADAGKERLLVSQERNELSDKIHAIEGAVLDALKLIADMARERQTERAEAAARLLEAGDYEQARAVLQRVDSPEIRADWRQAEQMADAGIEQIRALIEENRLRIQALRARGVDAETLPQLEACYRTSADAARKCHVEPDAVYDYADFLRIQNDYPRAIELCEWLEAEYRQTDADAETWARLWNLLGICHRVNKNFQKSETYYRAALERYRALAGDNPAAFAPDVAMTRNNLANLLQNANRYEEAETLYREALNDYRALADDNPALAPDVAAACNNLAALSQNARRYEDAETLYREALKIRRALAEANPAAFVPDVADTRNNLATLLAQSKRYEEAETLYREALNDYRALAEANPAALAPDVAMTCNNLAALLSQSKRYEEAETLYREALKIRRALAEANSAAFAPYVVDTCNNLAALLDDTRRYEEAEALYREALARSRALADGNPAALAVTCDSLAILLQKVSRYDEAEAFFREALDIRRALAKARPDAFLPAVAITCFNLGVFELKSRRNPAAAQNYFQEALSIYERFPRLAPEAARIRAILGLYF